jgi:hypothetical protein
VGIPSIAKMVSLDDLEPIFPSTGGILKGTPEQSINWSQPYALLLAENSYLGNRIFVGAGFSGSTAEIWVEGKATKSTTTKVRVRVQAKTSARSDLNISLFNWRTNAYENVTTPPISCDQTEKNMEVVVPDPLGKYLKIDGTIRAKIAFIQRGPSFTRMSASIDVVELGVR